MPGAEKRLVTHVGAAASITGVGALSQAKDERTDLRKGFDNLPEARKQEIRGAVAEIIANGRYETLERRIELVLEAVLDT